MSREYKTGPTENDIGGPMIMMGASSGSSSSGVDITRKYSGLNKDTGKHLHINTKKTARSPIVTDNRIYKS